MYAYFYLHICLCAMCMQLRQRSKEGSRSHWTRVTYGYDLGIEPESCERTANTLNYRTISPGPKLGFIQDLGAFKRKKAAKTCSLKWGFIKDISLNHCQPSGRRLSTIRAILPFCISIQESYSTVTIGQWSGRGVHARMLDILSSKEQHAHTHNTAGGRIIAEISLSIT